MPKPSVELVGFKRILGKLEAGQLLRRPVRNLLANVGRRGRDQGRSVAPRATDKLASSVTYRVDSKAVPTFVAVRVTAKNPRGVSYPRVLEFSPKHRHKSWLQTALAALMGQLAPEIDQAAREIEQDFSAR